MQSVTSEDIPEGVIQWGSIWESAQVSAYA